MLLLFVLGPSRLGLYKPCASMHVRPIRRAWSLGRGLPEGESILRVFVTKKIGAQEYVVNFYIAI